MRRAGHEARRPEPPPLLDAGENPERIDPREIRDAIVPRQVGARHIAPVASLHADADAEHEVQSGPARTRREQRVQRGPVTILAIPSTVAVTLAIGGLERPQRGALLGCHARRQQGARAKGGQKDRSADQPARLDHIR
jgi:hypothetical protein